MTGCLCIAGLGPGDERLVTPEVTEALREATDVVGYSTYVARVAPRANLAFHASDNGDEIARATKALEMAEAGRKIVVVSSGDPGVFAMAAAVFEALEAQPERWRDLDIRVLPGVTAMLAAAARVGAPLGHDCCMINLSDNLKPWSLVERRLRLDVEADFAIAIYNPRSNARPEGFAMALDILRDECPDDRPIIFARAVYAPEESIEVTTLSQASAEMADMRTLVIVGSTSTRLIERPGRAPFVYTPRSAPT